MTNCTQKSLEGRTEHMKAKHKWKALRSESRPWMTYASPLQPKQRVCRSRHRSLGTCWAWSPWRPAQFLPSALLPERLCEVVLRRLSILKIMTNPFHTVGPSCNLLSFLLYSYSAHRGHAESRTGIVEAARHSWDQNKLTKSTAALKLLWKGKTFAKFQGTRVWMCAIIIHCQAVFNWSLRETLLAIGLQDQSWSLWKETGGHSSIGWLNLYSAANVLLSWSRQMGQKAAMRFLMALAT